jgi:hypothetical protein
MKNTEIYKQVGDVYGSRYEVSNLGNVMSIKPSGNRLRMTLTENGAKENKKGYHSVTLRTEDGRTVKEYVSRLVAEMFLELPEGYERSKYVVNHLDGDIHKNVAENLVLKLKAQFSRERMSGVLRNKVTDARDLPADSILLMERIYSKQEILRKDGSSRLWVDYRKKFHNVSLIEYPGVIGPIRGTLIIRIDRDELPKYYQSYLTRKDLSQATNSFVTVPISVIMLEEIFMRPRPSLKHKPGYRDFNCLNITRENIAWETSEERNERIYDAIPALREKIRYTGSANRINLDSELTSEDIQLVKRLYFDEGLSPKNIVRKLGKEDSAYGAVYYRITQLKKAGMSKD